MDWEDENEGGSPYHTTNFEIFKFDFRNLFWNEVNNSSDNTLFVDHNHSILALMKDFIEFKQDCVYFVDNYKENYFKKAFECYDMRNFNLKTQVFKLMIQFTQIWLSSLFWIILKL